MPERKKSVFVFTLLLLLLSSFLILLTITLLFVYFFAYNNINERDNHLKSLNKYKYTELNLKENSTHSGLLRIPRHLQPDEIVTFQNERKGSLIIISSFEDSHPQYYQCHGTCSFKKSSKRRGTSSIFSNRGLHLLFSAGSLILAKKIADEAFRGECARFAEFYDEEDPEWDLFIEDCEKKLETFRADHMEEGYVRYKCNGECVDSEEFMEKYGHDERALKAKNKLVMEVGEECGALMTFQEIHIELELYGCKDASDKRCIDQAHLDFEELVLEDFCEEHSQVTLGKSGEEWNAAVCASKKPGDKVFPHIHCEVPKKMKYWVDRETGYKSWEDPNWEGPHN